MQERPRKKVGIIRLLISSTVLIAAVWVFFNRQFLIDHLTVWQYRPDSQVAALADRGQLSDQGEFYFYASRPVVSDRQTFNQRCAAHGERAAVLGCYVGQRIYIFDVTDQRLDGIKEVTAAHEMLHAVYERLSSADRQQINELLDTQLQQITDQRILELVKLYDDIEPGQRHNELHSIFGTEVAQLSEALEAHYARYFEDRAAVVELARSYESVFAAIETQQAQLVAELDHLAQQIETETQAYNAAAEQLSRDIDSFNRRADSGVFTSQAQFDAERSVLINRQAVVQSQYESIQGRIAIYEQKRTLLASLNGQIEELNQSINSNLLEPAPAI